MAITTNERSLLFELRRLMPPRPLHVQEGLKLAELQASRLLERFDIDQAGTPSELLTELRCVQVVERSDAPIAGGTIWLKPRWLMVLNASDSPTRMRFSLFHEFKHILDHPMSYQHYLGRTSSEQRYRAEQAANYFAACALMPRRLVKRLWGQGHQQIEDLANQFDVSEAAMTIRLEQIGLLDRELRSRCSRSPRFSAVQPDEYIEVSDSSPSLNRIPA